MSQNVGFIGDSPYLCHVVLCPPGSSPSRQSTWLPHASAGGLPGVGDKGTQSHLGTGSRGLGGLKRRLGGTDAKLLEHPGGWRPAVISADAQPMPPSTARGDDVRPLVNILALEPDAPLSTNNVSTKVRTNSAISLPIHLMVNSICPARRDPKRGPQALLPQCRAHRPWLTFARSTIVSLFQRSSASPD